LDWATASSLTTGVGTLGLAVATYASVRSANRAARVAERSLLAGLRPVLVESRVQDPPEQVGYVDEHWVTVPGGHAATEIEGETIYLAIALRNVGRGIAVLHGWDLRPDRPGGGEPKRPDLRRFRVLNRDIYVPAGGTGFWQGALRDPDDKLYSPVREAIKNSTPLTVDLLYGDHEGGQRTISRFDLQPEEPDGPRLASVSHHWNIDRPDPR
jgi:hypothetical protein